MKRIKLVYIVSDIDKALAFEWLATGLNREAIDFRFILLNPKASQLENFLLENCVRVRRISALNYLIVAALLIVDLLRDRPDIVHCHLRRAELAGIPAAYFLRISKRIFTRHSSTYNHLYHPKGVWIDKKINRLATDIIAISKNVKSVLIDREGVEEAKIHLVHHGFDLKYFSETDKGQIDSFKRRHNIPFDRKVIGIIARYTWWKGYLYSLSGIARFMEDKPGYFLVVANASGNNAEEIQSLLNEKFSPSDYREIRFESNLSALYHCFDLYVHVPFDSEVEAFGQTYVEALAAGVPSIFTLSGVAPEFIKHEYNALVVDFKSERQITDAFRRLESDASLRNKLRENGRNSVTRFDLTAFLRKLQEVYQGTE